MLVELEYRGRNQRRKNLEMKEETPRVGQNLDLRRELRGQNLGLKEEGATWSEPGLGGGSHLDRTWA